MKSIKAGVALLAATASAEVHLASVNGNETNGLAKIVNRCSYPVYLWSIDKQLGCASSSATKLSTGDIYKEFMRDGTNGGISIKLSKKDTCAGEDITQLEYKLVNDPDQAKAQYNGNYLDMSFVDCTGNLEDCPGRTDGFYLKAGDQSGLYKSAVNNEHCPVFNVYNAEEAVKVSYINWDDVQTKWCNLGQNLDLYLCGGEAPSDDDDSTPVSSAAPSSEIESSSAQPTSSSSSKEAAPSTTEDAFVVAAAAAVTSAPVVPAEPVVKTEVVYVTEFVKARHAHGRRHQHFHA